MKTKLYRIAKRISNGYLTVSKLHKIYLEEYGNRKGIPVVHLHGGPGSSSGPKYTKFYNPEKYRIIIFDQRGCGKSLPLGEIRENTTADLVNDMEKIRKHFGVDKWVVSGGSWGSTLALIYAERYPDRVTSLILRGIFTFRKSELDWVEKAGGASYFFPEEWEKFTNFIPKNEQSDMAKAYAKRVFGKNTEERDIVVQNAGLWELSIANLIPKIPRETPLGDKKELASSRVFYHYEVNGGFLKEGEILKNAGKLKNIPGILIQGRYDMVCPPITAWELHRAWPKSKLEIVMGGHHNTSKALWKKFVEYTDEFAEVD